MVDGLSIVPVRPIQAPRTGKSFSVEQERSSERAAREAERILTAENIKGAEAIKVRALIQQVKATNQTGQSAEAQRLARHALQKARELGNLPGITPPDDEEKEEEIQSAPDAEDLVNDAPAETGSPLDEPESSLYQDASGDAGISFKMGAPLTELQAPLAVRAHETTHLLHESQEAILEGRRVLSGIRILSRIDPNTGQRHVAGGRARVVIFPKIEPPKPKEPNIDLKA